MKNEIPTENENPKGLHQRFVLRKIVGMKREGFFDSEKFITEPVADNAEYFVLRLDENGKDFNHIKACRIGIHAYAEAIEATIPELAKDLRERYPLL